MMQNIYKQTKIKNYKINKYIKSQNIYKQAKIEYCKKSN